MAVKVAINGFGRIGRLAFRQMFGAEGFEIVTQGKYALADKVEAGEDSITVDGKEIKIYAKANAAELPWGEIGVDVVLECTGFYTSKAKAQAHIDAGAKKVVISAPAGNDLPTIVYNVNHESLTKDDNICCILYNKLPRSDGKSTERPCTDQIRYHVHDPRLHRRSDDS